MNRLSKEKSPYLLQHAENPVNWFPWGHEAFEQAKKDDKPIFLSIGYSTCHWCHVMAHESFEDAEVAALLNRDYIAVKVDREERPDVDAVYMAVCQMFTGAGGWPLTVIMTPDQKPFWAGTYLPKTSAYGRAGLVELLAAVKKLWDGDRGKLTLKGEQIAALLNERSENGGGAEPDKVILAKTVGQFKSAYDKRRGGFGSAPKFPTPHNLIFLLRYSQLEKDGTALQMASHTLAQMFRGGIFDHIGGGFSRYSTDEKWLVPHFEKMLYDNALLILAYLDAYHITGEPLFKTVAERTINYALCELRDEKGGFYCGQDADSDGVEGKYYTFQRNEIFDIFGERDGEAFCDWYGITERGNFEGGNIPNLLDNPRYAEENLTIKTLADKLYAYRLERTRLHKDDKALASWNALMIAALAKAGWLLKNPDYTQAAKEADNFIKNNLTDENGNLKLRWRENEAAHNGQLDDYAFYAFALTELYAASYEAEYLSRAADISARMLDLFWDNERGGFFIYSKEGEQLISRPKETYDGALPSGNSAAAVVIGRLSKLTGEAKWREISRRQLRFLTGEIKAYPMGHSMALLAVSEAVYPSRELVVTAEGGVPERLNEFLREKPIIGLTMLVKTRENQSELKKAAPFTADYPIPESGAAYYLCGGGACNAPTGDIETLLKEIRR